MNAVPSPTCPLSLILSEEVIEVADHELGGSRNVIG